MKIKMVFNNNNNAEVFYDILKTGSRLRVRSLIETSGYITEPLYGGRDNRYEK